MSAPFREEIFSPAFPLAGPHLVAASAGTGKTHNIQNVCARLVAERGLRISEILVMTFTEAATKELRDRVRAVLANLQRLYAGDTAGLDPRELERLERLRACSRAAPGGAADAVAKTRVELALLEFDRAAISTIHGFCRHALVRFAFETGGAFRTELGDDGGAELARRVRDWWRVERPDFPLADVAAAAAGLGGKTGWTLDPDADGAPDPRLVAAARIVERYEEDRPLRDGQTFDDLLRAVRDVLADPVRGPVLAERLRGEFKAVVVDEFQDTDPVQYGIFRAAFVDGVPEGERPPVFFVGDPKQAIYAFRGGDVFTYRAAAKQVGAARTYRLDRNFRSTPKLVDAVNRLFGDERNPDGSVAARTFGADEIPYDEDVGAAEDAGSRIDGLAGPDGAEDPHPFRVVRARTAADRDAAVVAAVLETLDGQKGRTIRIKGADEPFGPKHVAVLAPSNDSARAFGAALRARGVPAVVSKSGNVFAGETAAELRLVLLAMADPGDRGRIRAALATPFFDFPVERLADGGDDAFADRVGSFARLNRTWNRRGFNAAFAELEDGCNLRVRFAAMPGGERKLADLFQIVDLANAAIRERGPAPDTLADWITERINLSGDASEADADEYARELESDADAVKVMTIHKAKGLEFPVTVVSVPSARGGGAGLPCFYHDETGALHASAVGTDAAVREAEQERTRLLYVAFTRATRRAVVVAADNPVPSFSVLLDNARRRGAGEDNPPDSPLLWSDFDPGAAPPDRRPDAAAGGELAQAAVPRDYAPFRANRKGSYSSLAPSARDAPVGSAGETAFDASAADAARDTDGGIPEPAPDEDAADGADAVHPVFAIGGGARTGTCWHDILETLPFDAGPDRIREETGRSMRLHGLARGEKAEVESRIDTVADMIRKTLDWPLRSPDGAAFRLRDVPARKRFSEWEFGFSSAQAADRTPALAAILRDEWKDDPGKKPFLAALADWDREIPKGFFVGFVDLLFEHGGFWYVVDWKSNRIGGRKESFSAEGVRAEMAREGYFFQYLLYAAALHRFLGETMGPVYSWEKHFGGVRYCFLRGIAAGGAGPVFADRPGERLLERLCEALGLGGRKA